MLSGFKHKLPIIDFPFFKQLVVYVKEKLQCKNLILSGAEITTFKDLDKFIDFAASLSWFEKIQIQTNGRNLADRNYLQRLIDAGLNEVFLSLHGLETAHELIARKKGAFKEAIAGLHNLDGFDINVITNTVLTRINYQQVAALMNYLSEAAVREVHLWNYFPMRRADERDLIVRVKDARDLIPEVLNIVKASGKVLVLKNFPECLPVQEPGYFDNGFPETFIGEPYWEAFEANQLGQCVHRANCKAQTCWGLSHAHVQKYGYEESYLAPIGCA